MNQPQINSALEDTDLMRELISNVQVLHNDYVGLEIINTTHQDNLISRIQNLHPQDKRRLLARIKREARKCLRQSNYSNVDNYYSDLARYFYKIFMEEIGSNLETKAEVNAPSSELKEIVGSALSLYNSSTSQNTANSVEDMIFRNMDLRAKYAVHKELRRIAEKAAGMVDFATAKIYSETAAHLWENYIVVSRRF